MIVQTFQMPAFNLNKQMFLYKLFRYVTVGSQNQYSISLVGEKCFLSQSIAEVMLKLLVSACTCYSHVQTAILLILVH